MLRIQKDLNIDFDLLTSVKVMKEHPYNPYTRAHGYQYYSKICTNCGGELSYERESGHQHRRWVGRDLENIVEIDGAVYLKCACGNHVRTALKPMTASITCDHALERGYVSSSERCRQIHRRYHREK